MDAALPSKPFPTLTRAKLEEILANPGDRGPKLLAMMKAEVERRRAVAAGDESQMTAGERFSLANARLEAERARLRAFSPMRPCDGAHGTDGLALFEHDRQAELF